LEEENGRLKRLAADQAVQIQVLKEVNSKKWQARRPSDGR
jgi:putative transposase